MPQDIASRLFSFIREGPGKSIGFGPMDEIVVRFLVENAEQTQDFFVQATESAALTSKALARICRSMNTRVKQVVDTEPWRLFFVNTSDGPPSNHPLSVKASQTLTSQVLEWGNPAEIAHHEGQDRDGYIWMEHRSIADARKHGLDDDSTYNIACLKLINCLHAFYFGERLFPNIHPEAPYAVTTWQDLKTNWTGITGATKPNAQPPIRNALVVSTELCTFIGRGPGKRIPFGEKSKPIVHFMVENAEQGEDFFIQATRNGDLSPDAVSYICRALNSRIERILRDEPEQDFPVHGEEASFNKHPLTLKARSELAKQVIQLSNSPQVTHIYADAISDRYSYKHQTSSEARKQGVDDDAVYNLASLKLMNCLYAFYFGQPLFPNIHPQLAKPTITWQDLKTNWQQEFSDGVIKDFHEEPPVMTAEALNTERINAADQQAQMLMELLQAGALKGFGDYGARY